MHLLESSYIPLELYFEHRNYMSMIGPIMASVWYLNVLLERSMLAYWRRAEISLFAFVLVFMVWQIWQTWQNSSLWGSRGHLITYWALNQPNSNRAQSSYSDFLAANGFPEESLQRLRRAHELYPKEITTLLHMWNRACVSGMVAPYSLTEIKDMDGLQYHHNDVNFHLKELVQNLTLNKCSSPSPESVLAIFDIIGEFPLSDYRRASYHALYSDLFVHYRQLDPALIQLRYAFEYEADPQILIRQAMLSVSAGRNSDALVFLERARTAGSKQSLLRSSDKEEILRIETDINNFLRENQ